MKLKVEREACVSTEGYFALSLVILLINIIKAWVTGLFLYPTETADVESVLSVF